MRGMENRQTRILNLIDKIIDDGGGEAVRHNINETLRSAFLTPEQFEQQMLGVVGLPSELLKQTPESARKAADARLKEYLGIRKS